jgi:hypothetical protein
MQINVLILILHIIALVYSSPSEAPHNGLPSHDDLSSRYLQIITFVNFFFHVVLRFGE